MVARADAELLVGSWAEDATRRQGDGREFTPMLEEFEHGFVVWVRQPEGVRAEPGSGVRRVIDRVTGEISTWGSIPPPMVADQYRRHRQEFPAGAPTIDPVASIRGLARPGQITLNTAVHVTLGHDRRMRIAYGAKGDQELNHHPVVRDFLAARPVGHLSRGAERHAEMIVVSDILHSYDSATGAPTSLEVARQLFESLVGFEKRRIRPESAQTQGGKAFSCFSCVELLVHIGLYPPIALTETYGPVANTVFPRERPNFPPELLPFMSERGFEFVYTPFDRPAREDDNTMHDPAAPLPQVGLEMCRRYVQCVRSGSEPGRAHRVEDFWYRPQGFIPFRGLADDLGRLLGVRAFPVGHENTREGVLVGDEHGRLFLIDQAGEWFLGETDDEALITLYYGREQRRIRDDGTW